MNDARRWRLVLGAPADEDLGAPEGIDLGMDRALAALYEREEGAAKPRAATLGASAPSVARWLGDVRSYFPTSVVSLLQKDAVERLGLHKLLLEPELLDTLEPSVELVTTLVALSRSIPRRARDSARKVVRKVTDELERHLAPRVSQAIRGTLHALRTSRPRPRDIDWPRTFAKNLGRSVKVGDPPRWVPVPERLVGWRRRDTALKDVILCVDQSGSMATSLVYASVMGAVMASLRSLRTHFVVFDTDVADLTAELSDPVDLLFGAQLGGGTDIGRALAYCRTLVMRPRDTVLVLISDLHDGGDPTALHHHASELVRSGVTVIALLALSDEGTPGYSHEHAQDLAALGIPSFACTPDRFPELMGAALRGELGGPVPTPG